MKTIDPVCGLQSRVLRVCEFPYPIVIVRFRNYESGDFLVTAGFLEYKISLTILNILSLKVDGDKIRRGAFQYFHTHEHRWNQYLIGRAPRGPKVLDMMNFSYK
jgi:hypothetical protein